MIRGSTASANVWHRRAVPLGIAVITFLGLALTAPKGFFEHHTPFNHFALLAEGWLRGRLDLGGPPPVHTQFNDFALFEEKFFVSFPPFPAVLLLPFVALFGSADATPDGAIFLVVGAAAPAIFYLALAQLRAARRGAASPAAERADIILALALPFCTVFWFSAVQGTVWFAAHVVGVALASAYLWASVNARRPILAGAFLVLAFATRTPMALAAPFFLLELLARARTEQEEWPAAILAMLKPIGWFVLPITVGLFALCAYNQARFNDPFEFGHRHLQVVWRPRMDKWGLFSLHYLGKNLGVALAGMPFFGDPSRARPTALQITGHGLALWITSPFLLLALWRRPLPARQRLTYIALAVTAALIAIPDLLYHNTGWVQFGYRFSNDFIVFVLAMLAIGRKKHGPTLYVLLAWSFAVNLFGALSFQRPGWEKYYKYDVRPDTYFEPD